MQKILIITSLLIIPFCIAWGILMNRLPLPFPIKMILCIVGGGIIGHLIAHLTFKLIHLKGRLEQYRKYKIYWHKLIPFVIAEITNPEWDKLQTLIKEKNLTAIPKLYNSNGNWYVLEGLDYFLLEKEWWTDRDENLLFNDSLHSWFNGKPDEEKYKMLIDSAKRDINFIWKSIWKKIIFLY